MDSEGATLRGVDRSDPENTGSPRKMRSTCLNCGRTKTAGCVMPWIDVIDGRSVPAEDVSFLCDGCDQVAEQRIEILKRGIGTNE